MIGIIAKGIGKVAFRVVEYIAAGIVSIALNEEWEDYKEKRDNPKEPTPKPKPAPEQKINQFQNNLNFYGLRLLERDPEINSLAREIDVLEKRGEFDNPFNRRARELEGKLKALLQSKMEPMAQQEADNLGIKYQMPISSFFRR